MAVAVEEIARGCSGTSLIYVVHLTLCAAYIQAFGTENQKQRFLPPLARGEAIGAFALTEPESGSDASALRTTATRADGHYLLNGSKMFITNAPEADTFVIMASHDRSLRARGIDTFIVEGDTPGLTVTRLQGQMGMRASSTGEVAFQDCPVPEENRLGREGDGFRAAMQVLDAGRIGIAAQCVGIAQAAYEASVTHATRRRAFGQELAGFQAIQWMIADMDVSIDAARLLVVRAATLRDQGLPFAVEASMAKLYASKTAVDCADRAVQIHGGAGYFAPHPVERYYRDAKVTEIYEGTSEIQRLIISRSIFTDTVRTPAIAPRQPAIAPHQKVAVAA